MVEIVGVIRYAFDNPFFVIDGCAQIIVVAFQLVEFEDVTILLEFLVTNRIQLAVQLFDRLLQLLFPFDV